MKRMTEQHYKKTDGYYMKCSEHCCKEDFSCEDCEKFDELVDRLAAIEDILGGEYELDRLREMVEVDRLKGKEVWSQAKYLRTFPVDPDCIERATILYISLLKGGEILCHTQGRAFSIDEIGKTVFFSRVEAVAALKARE